MNPEIIGLSLLSSLGIISLSYLYKSIFVDPRKREEQELKSKIVVEKHTKLLNAYQDMKRTSLVKGEIIEITTESFFDSPNLQDLSRHSEVYEVLKNCSYSTMAEKINGSYDISELPFLYALQRNNCIKKTTKKPSRSITFEEYTICPI